MDMATHRLLLLTSWLHTSNETFGSINNTLSCFHYPSFQTYSQSLRREKLPFLVSMNLFIILPFKLTASFLSSEKLPFYFKCQWIGLEVPLSLYTCVFSPAIFQEKSLTPSLFLSDNTGWSIIHFLNHPNLKKPVNLKVILQIYRYQSVCSKIMILKIVHVKS